MAERTAAVTGAAGGLSCKAVIPAMRAARYGRSVIIGSLLAKNGGNPRPWIDRSKQARAGNAACAAHFTPMAPVAAQAHTHHTPFKYWTDHE